MILRKIKQLLGMGSGSDGSGRSGQDVVVQEKRSDPETEAAVKGVDEGGSVDAAEEAAETAEEPAETEGEPVEGTTEADEAHEADEELGSGDVDEPVAAGTDASASTESLVDEAEATEHPESRAEPAEAAGPGADDETTDVEEADSSVEDPDTSAEDTDSSAEDADEVADTEVDEIKGIGPAYSDRLGDVGINSVAQLAEADAADLAERTSVPEGTVQKWIDRAQEF